MQGSILQHSAISMTASASAVSPMARSAQERALSTSSILNTHLVRFISLPHLSRYTRASPYLPFAVMHSPSAAEVSTSPM